LIERFCTATPGTAALTERVFLSVAVCVTVPVCVPVASAVAVTMAVTVSMTVALADLGVRQLPEASFLEGLDAGGNIRFPGEVHPEACPLKTGIGAAAQSTAEDGVRRAAQHGVERAASAVLMAPGRVPHGFPLAGVQVEECEEGRGPEVG